MNILLALIPLSLLLLGAAVWAFAWAVKRGQFDDLDTPALDILADEDERRAEARSGQAAATAADATDAGAPGPGPAPGDGADDPPAPGDDATGGPGG